MKVFFDRRYGVRTEDKVEAQSLGINAADCCGYMPYKRRSLGRILRYQEVSDQDVFLDAGSGMGRVVLQAALKYPFGGEVFEQFVQRLLDSIDRHPRMVRIIYVNPREEARLLATGRVTLIRSQGSWHSTPAGIPHQIGPGRT